MMQPKTAMEARRTKRAFPRLVQDSALSFETFVHVHVRTTYDQMCLAKTIKTKPPEVTSWDRHEEHVWKSSGSISSQRRVHYVYIKHFWRQMCAFYAVACDHVFYCGITFSS